MARPVTSVQPVDGPPMARRRVPLRLFAGTADEPRARRATDGLLLGLTVVTSGALVLVVRRTSMDAQLADWLNRIVPNQLDAVWWSLIGQLVLIAGVSFVLPITRARFALVRDLALSAALAYGGCTAMGSLLRADTTLGVVLTSTAAAAVVAVSPHLTRPSRRLGRWSVVFALVGLILVGPATPAFAVGSVLVAVIAATVVHLALGSCKGRPSVDDIVLVLEWLGITPVGVGAAERQPAGVFVVEATEPSGAPLSIKVYGRDSYDTQLVTSVWRKVWYRDTDAPTFNGRRQQAEHEAFVTLLAAQAGVATERVLMVASTEYDDVVLVLRGDTHRRRPSRWSPELAEAAWATLRTLHGEHITHGQLGEDNLTVGPDGRIGILDFRAAVVNPTDTDLETDRAQLLLTTALALGTESAVGVAARALGRDELARALPHLQLPLLTPDQRRAVRRQGVDLEAIRSHAGDVIGVESRELRRLRRVTLRSALEMGLLVVAFFALWTGLGGLDFGELVHQLGHATVWLVIVGFVLAQLPRLTQTVSTMGASPIPIPAGPLYALQLASGYLSLAVPSSAGRIAMNVRFFQRRGLKPGSALAVGALDGLAQWVIQAGLVAGALLVTSATLDLDLGPTVAAGVRILWVVVVVIVVAAGLALTLVRPFRRAVVGRGRTAIGESMEVVQGLWSSLRLGMLIGGNLGTELLFVTALVTFAASMGYRVDFFDVLVVLVSVSLIAAVLPIPGGIGIVETGLVVGFVGMGMSEDAAVAVVILYRVSTFFLPPVWGYFAQRWLLRSGHL